MNEVKENGFVEMTEEEMFSVDGGDRDFWPWIIKESENFGYWLYDVLHR